MSRSSWWSILIALFLLNGGYIAVPGVHATIVMNCYAAVSDGDGHTALMAVTPQGNSSAIGTTIGGGESIRAIANWPAEGGRLYAIAGSRVGLVDPSGQFSPLGQPLGQGNGRLGLQTFDNGQALTVDPLTGLIYATILTSGLDLLVQVDGEQGRAIPGAFVQPTADYLPIQTPPKLGDIIAIAVDPFDGQMYAAANDGGVESTSWLIRIDKARGLVTTIGSLGVPMRGLSFTNDGALLGIGSNHLYQIDKLSAGTLSVHPLSSAGDHKSITCLTGAANRISGTIFADGNANGVPEAGEAGTPGISVRLYRDTNPNGRVDSRDSLVASAVIDAAGAYAFTVAATGDFLLDVDRRQLPRHHTLTIDNLHIAHFDGFGQHDADNNFGHVNNRFVADEVIVRFKPPMDHQGATTLLALQGLKVKRYLGRLQAYLVITAPGTVDATIDRLLAESYILYAEPNYVVQGAVSPNDPDYNDPSKVYAPPLLNASAAWSITTGSSSLIVAVIDSGISLTHPEFAGRIVPGYDFVNGDNDPSDDHGHGTHVAGILAAAINNGHGSVGIAPNVSLLPVKVLNSQNSGTWADISAGITYAVDRGAKVLNLSLGGTTESQMLADAIQYAAGRGVLIVAAAGNSTTNVPFYPAYYIETMGVAATTKTDKRWASSNYGTYIEVAAPGEEVWSTDWSPAGGDSYKFLSGTSMSAPHVSGLAALILSQRPTLTAANVRSIIQQSAVDLGDVGRDDLFGHGRINVGDAVNLSQNWTPPTPTPTTTPTPAPYLQRVNVGGTTFTDGQGQTWAADKAYAVGSWGFTTGRAKSYTTAVADTTDDLLYQRQRELAGEYRFTVPNGTYNVTLKFAEFSVTTATARAMNIILEATSMETNFSVFALAGRARALDRSYTVTVYDGILNIVFTKAAGAKSNPAISAIEVKMGAPLPPTPTPTPTATPCLTCPTPTPIPTNTPVPYDQRVNVGGTTFTDGAGQSWTADKAYTVGSWGYSTRGSAKSYTTAVAETTDDLLYQKQRWLAGEYRFTVPNGTYEVTLKLAEFSVSNATDRVMRITMEGVVVESSLSVWALAGRAKAMDRTYTVTVNDGILNIAFARASGARQDPAISAIRVRSR